MLGVDGRMRAWKAVGRHVTLFGGCRNFLNWQVGIQYSGDNDP
jgi:hypothetical protein